MLRRRTGAPPTQCSLRTDHLDRVDRRTPIEESARLPRVSGSRVTQLTAHVRSTRPESQQQDRPTARRARTRQTLLQVEQPECRLRGSFRVLLDHYWTFVAPCAS